MDYGVLRKNRNRKRRSQVLKKPDQKLKATALKVVNDIAEGLDGGESRAVLRKVISWLADGLEHQTIKSAVFQDHLLVASTGLKLTKARGTCKAVGKGMLETGLSKVDLDLKSKPTSRGWWWYFDHGVWSCVWVLSTRGWKLLGGLWIKAGLAQVRKADPKCKRWPRCGCILQGRQSDCPSHTVA